jgi:hypothetical protein
MRSKNEKGRGIGEGRGGLWKRERGVGEGRGERGLRTGDKDRWTKKGKWNREEGGRGREKSGNGTVR